MKVQFIASLALVPLLASCAAFGSGGPSVISSTPQGATIKFDEGKLDDATAKANDLCRMHGQSAVLQRVTPQSGNKRVASFDCR